MNGNTIGRKRDTGLNNRSDIMRAREIISLSTDKWQITMSEGAKLAKMKYK